MNPGSFFGRLSRAADLATEEPTQTPTRTATPAHPQEQTTSAPTQTTERPPVPSFLSSSSLSSPSPSMPRKRAIAAKSPVQEALQEDDTNVEAFREELAETTSSEDAWDTEVEGQLTIDVYQTDNAIVIVSTIAGVEHDELDISIDNDMVTIQGERHKDEEIDEDKYYYQECYFGAFSRSIILPCDVKAEEAEAELKNGILTITLPKANTTKAKKIAVKARG